MSFNNTKIFLSHAWEDKDNVAREMADILSKSVKVWYDEYSIHPGGSIFQSINSGLTDCDFGVVIFSKYFFAKRWTKSELSGLYALEDFGKRIIPIWHEITYDEVCTSWPVMIDRKAINTSEGINAVVEFVLRAIRTADTKDAFIHTGTVDSLYGELGKIMKVSTEKEALFRSEHGAEKVFCSQTKFFELADKRITEVALASPQIGLTWTSSEIQCIPNDKVYLNIKCQNNIMLKFEGTRPSKCSIDIARIEITLLKMNLDQLGECNGLELIIRHVFTPKFDDTLDVLWQEVGLKEMSTLEVIDFGLGLLHGHLVNWMRGRYGD